MDPASGRRGVEDKAGGGERVVGDAGALIGRYFGVGFTGRYYRDAAGGESRAEADREREGDVLLENAIADAGAGICASVGGIDHDRKGRLHGQAIGEGRGQRGQAGLSRRQRRRGRWRLLGCCTDRKVED